MPILNWLNKDEAVTATKQCAYRLLEEVPQLSYGNSANENLLIQGDNLEALKALIPFYAGKVKCIFIDPPYNTRSAFEHYDDNLEHSQWLNMLYPRLELLRELLSEQGSLWMTLDDNESAYARVIGDEIFGRRNFVSQIAWQKVFAKKNKALISGSHDNLLVFAKNIDSWNRNLIPREGDQLKAFKNPDNDPRGSWQSVSYTVQSEDSDKRKSYRYPIILPSGRQVTPPPGRHWNGLEARTQALVEDNRLWFGKDGDNPPRLKVFLSEVQNGIVPDTWWDHKFAGNNQDAKKEVLAFANQGEPFNTPKPEQLVYRILSIASSENDLILDSFLGSGTTVAVAQKMNRTYIGIEIGEHALTHCQPRLMKVVNGEQGGISKAIKWQGGGGFRFCKLGSEVFDEFGCLNPEIKFSTLAAHLWYLETRTTLVKTKRSPLLGKHKDTTYYLLYNGILGDRRPQGGNVLTSKVLANLPKIENCLAEENTKIVVYGESSRLGSDRLTSLGITFKQIPYDVGSI